MFKTKGSETSFKFKITKSICSSNSDLPKLSCDRAPAKLAISIEDKFLILK
jgi:hypothetical protein